MLKVVVFWKGATCLRLSFWISYSIGLFRAVEMLGLGSECVAALSLRCRFCVANQQEATVLSVGGAGMEVEIWKWMRLSWVGSPRGLHGHKKQVKSDIIVAYKRSSGVLLLETYDKLIKDEECIADSVLQA